MVRVRVKEEKATAITKLPFMSPPRKGKRKEKELSARSDRLGFGIKQ